MNKLLRKTLLYKTGVEYGAHQPCVGLFSWLHLSMLCIYDGSQIWYIKDYNDWLEPKLVENSIDLLKKDPYKQKSIKVRASFCLPLTHLCMDILK